MSTIKLNGREVCWDMYLSEKNDGIGLMMHKPQKRNIILECTKDWEGRGANYPEIIKYGDKFRFYYRASGYENPDFMPYCVLESDDGINFVRKNLGLHEFQGSKDNNIFHTEDRIVDNFAICLDTNPACPADARFKALSMFIQGENHEKRGLALYKSADGLSFEFERILDVDGVFDSHNVLMWDENEKVYRIYMRDFHDKEGRDIVYKPDDAYMEDKIRDIRLTKSKDLVTWSKPERISFGDNAEDMQFYTNQITKYNRADIYLGMPTRYINRIYDAAPDNFNKLPAWNGRRALRIADKNRAGTAATDAVLITSRDGFNFKRCDEAFISPGLEEEYNWIYGDCYLSHGFVETPMEDHPDKTELSFYMGEMENKKETKRFVRYSVRLDGFFSWHADFKGGSMMTKPLSFEGDTLSINFASSALGGVRIAICDENGEILEGYDSGILFGDSLDREVSFQKPLRELSGKSVRLLFELKDCDLYSFNFYNKECAK